ncbi:MAG TPA: XDD4 family exosortase-dependent surface protein [Bryobacteraceae bacterium]|nr:XDD4 family exosortase-dependent surface protein [Bryobacteraceae bacterium]
MLNLRIAGIAFAATLLLGTAGLNATPVVFSGSSGSLAASVSFQVVGSELIVQLTNTSLFDVLVPSDVLTAVFFDVEAAPMFTRNNVQVGNGSSVLFGGMDSMGLIGGEWAYLGGSVTQGISSAGLGLFGPGNAFPGGDRSRPNSPGGIQYGITSAGDNPLTGNKRVTGAQPLIKSSVSFSLGGVSQGFSESDISNVRFQYGADLAEPSFGGEVPEPSSALFATIGVVAIVIGRLRRRRVAR